MTTLYDRINTLLRLDIARNNAGVPQDKYRDASAAIADNALGIINELCERMEKSQQIFQDVEELDINNDELSSYVNEGLILTDIVQDYKVDRVKMELEA